MSRRGHCLYFFLTPAEQVALLEDFEARHQVAYYRAHTSAVPEVSAIASLVSEKRLGHLSIGDWNHSLSYLLAFSGEGVVVEQITLRKGGSVYAVNQGENPTLACLRPGGHFTEGVLVAGSV